MMSRVIELKNKPCVIASASAVGKNEGEGPLQDEFDVVFPDDGIKQSSWENAESELMFTAVNKCLEKSGLSERDIGMIFAGDLINQCTSSTYAMRGFDTPFCGLFGACSTMAYSLALAAVMVDGGYADYSLAATSSHFCSAEKQFRYPLEYGSQRAPASQRTVTGSGAFIIGKCKQPDIIIPRIQFGIIADAGVNDTSNMGAAMAPAAAESIVSFLEKTGTNPTDYDLILTGDLGKVGSELLKDYLYTRKSIDISKVHNDCGLMIYDLASQDVDSGGSGCGCSAVVLASHFLPRLLRGEIKDMIIVGTGALMSPSSIQQGLAIPGVAHLIRLCSEV